MKTFTKEAHLYVEFIAFHFRLKQWSDTSRQFVEKSFPKYLIFPLILSWKYVYILGKLYMTVTIKYKSRGSDHEFAEY